MTSSFSSPSDFWEFNSLLEIKSLGDPFMMKTAGRGVFASLGNFFSSSSLCKNCGFIFKLFINSAHSFFSEIKP